MASINTRDKVHFRIYLLNRKSFGHELSQLRDQVMGNIFGKHFEQFR